MTLDASWTENSRQQVCEARHGATVAHFSLEIM